MLSQLCAVLLAAGMVVPPKNINSAREFSGFLKVAPKRELYVEWHKAPEGQPTVVLLNGLTYSTEQWETFSKVLIRQGFGVLRYDMWGMGKTLDRSLPLPQQPIAIADQVQDLSQLLEQADIKGPVDLVGLSYGGGVGMAFAAAHPGKVDNLIVQAPYTEAVAEQDEWILEQVQKTRKMFPLNPASDEELYDFFLWGLVHGTYPSAEPGAFDNPFRNSFKLDGIFRMIQGIRKWNAREALPNIPAGSLHLMIAGKDQYLKRDVMEDFWASVPEVKRGSLVLLNNTEHKIPEAVPFFAANWVGEILRKNHAINNGRRFDADPFTGKIYHDGGKIEFPSERQGQKQFRGGP